jgi:hypothetical protein
MSEATLTRKVGEALATDYFLVRDQLTDEQWTRFMETAASWTARCCPSSRGIGNVPSFHGP